MDLITRPRVKYCGLFVCIPRSIVETCLRNDWITPVAGESDIYEWTEKGKQAMCTQFTEGQDGS